MIDVEVSGRELRIAITAYDAVLLDVRSLWRGRRWELAVPLEHVVGVKVSGRDPRRIPFGFRHRHERSNQARGAEPKRYYRGRVVCVRRKPAHRGAHVGR